MSYPTKAGRWRALPLSVPRHRAVVRARLQCCTQPRFAAQTHDTLGQAQPRATGMFRWWRHWELSLFQLQKGRLGWSYQCIFLMIGKYTEHEPDSSQCYLLSGHETTGTKWNTGNSISFYFLFFFLIGSGQTQDGAVQSGCGVSIPEDTQTATGQEPKHSALFDLAFSGRWTRSATEIISHLSYSVTIILD